jgi:hypothetical protein
MKRQTLSVLMSAMLIAGSLFRPALGADAAGPGRAPKVDSAAAAAVKVMPLGDSITGSPGCWRAKLWTRLQSNGDEPQWLPGMRAAGGQPQQRHPGVGER